MESFHGSHNTFLIGPYDQIKNFSFKDVIQDGVIFIKENPLEMIVYNKDGSLASMCGNGIRSFIHYCYIHNLIKDCDNLVKTKSGHIRTIITSYDDFRVRVYFPNKIYHIVNDKIFINNKQYDFYLIDVCVKHCIIILKDFNECNKLIEIQLKNLKDYNIDFIKIEEHIYVKTFERGVGFTKSCGTGVLATYLVLKKLNLIHDKTVIYTDGGLINVGIDDIGPFLEGPSRKIT